MSATPPPNPLLATTADPGLYVHLQRLASAQRCAFFAGLPGTGKSLLGHHLTHLAHAQEREDAPLQVLRDLWRHLARIAPALGVGATLPASAADVSYDPVLYQAVYQRLLTQRQVLVLPLDTILPTTTLSVYDFAVPRQDVVPTVEEVTHW